MANCLYNQGTPTKRERLSTVDLLVLTSLGQFLLILLIDSFTKQATVYITRESLLKGKAQYS